MEQWCNGCGGSNQSWFEAWIVNVESPPIDAIIPIRRSGLVYITFLLNPGQKVKDLLADLGVLLEQLILLLPNLGGLLVVPP